jgi:tetratricopeptide (TPR) repeat protein/peroxiredoxin
VSQSPLDARPAGGEVDEYLANWNAVATRIREGASFSGREPNCCFLNTAGPRFADVSAALGIDYTDDGRGLALCDWDQDGDIDLWLANRTGPSVRLLRNQLNRGQHYVALLLEGTSCNRDAIGARVELVIRGAPAPQIKTLRAGEGFLSQSSKWIHFGLGAEGMIDELHVRWPGEHQAEVFRGLSADRRYRIKQGGLPQVVETTRRAPPVATAPTLAPPHSLGSRRGDSIPPQDDSVTADATSRTVLTQRRPLPQLVGMTAHDGRAVAWQPPNKPTLLVLWASWCRPCLTELTALAGHAPSLAAKELDVIACNTDGLSDAGDEEVAARFIAKLNVPFRWVRASTDMAAELTRWQHERFYRQRPLPLPCSFLLDRRGRVAVIYQGPVSAEQLIADLELLDAPGATLLQAAMPHGGRNIVTWFSPDPVRIAAAWLEGGYLDDAERELLHIVRPGNRAAATDPLPTSGDDRLEAWQMLAQIARQRGDAAAEVAAWESLAGIDPDRFEYALQRALALLRHGRRTEADALLEELTSRANSAMATHEPFLLLGQAYLQLGRVQESIACFQSALQRKPADLESRFGMALALQARGDRSAAIDLYRQLLAERPEFHMAANNLAWLLAVGQDADPASRQEAIELGGRICAATGRTNASFLDTLAVALAAAGQASQAETTLQEAIQVARSRGETAMVERLQTRAETLRRRQLPPE